MSEHIYTDNSACKICMNCRFYNRRNFTCLADDEDEEVWAYATACEQFEQEGGSHE